MELNQIFNKGVFSMTTKTLLEDINSLIKDITPEDKDPTDFTGGYVQQLKNSVQFVAYFGTKLGSRNRETVKIDIELDEMDMMYAMLKVKIHDMRAGKKKKISLMERSVTRKKEKGW